MEEIVLIIGGSSGIGLACAKKFISNSYKTIIAGRSKEKLVRAQKEINNKLCSILEFDIKSSTSLSGLVGYIRNNNYKINLLINSAGINTPNRDFNNLDYEESSEIIKTNLEGPLNLSKAIIEEMRKTGGGTIIHIGSVASIRTTKLSGVAYSASKMGLLSLVRSINLNETKNNIRASIICPASVNTPLILNRPLPPSEKEKNNILQPENIANIAYFIATQPRNVVIDEVIITSIGEVELI